MSLGKALFRGRAAMAKHIRIEEKPPAVVSVPVSGSWKARQKSDPYRIRRIYVSEVIRAVAANFKVTPQQLIGESRTQDLMVARHVVAYIASRISLASKAGIGRALGDRDHSTICSSLKKIEKLFLLDPKLKPRVESIETKLDSVSALSESSAPGDPTSPQPKSPGATIHD